MRWLVTGAGGQLGRELVGLLTVRGSSVLGLDRAGLDVTSAESIQSAVTGFRPQVIVNCAAYTAVDAAETDEAAATAVNGTGPGLLAAAARESGARLLHISTDYVFDGNGSRPYLETDPIGPASAYGRSKAAGEQAALAAWPDGTFVIRTAWVYGGHGSNFAKTMLKLAASQSELRVVADQTGQPTWTGDLAAGLIELGTAGATPGIYHCTNAGETTWYGFARELFEVAGLDPDRISPVTTAEFPRPAPRPSYSVLDCGKWNAAGLTPLNDWRDALRRSGVVAQ